MVGWRKSLYIFVHGLVLFLCSAVVILCAILYLPLTHNIIVVNALAIVKWKKWFIPIIMVVLIAQYKHIHTRTHSNKHTPDRHWVWAYPKPVHLLLLSPPPSPLRRRRHFFQSCTLFSLLFSSIRFYSKPFHSLATWSNSIFEPIKTIKALICKHLQMNFGTFVQFIRLHYSRYAWLHFNWKA